MEAATKWDPVRLDARDDLHHIYSNVRLIDQQVNPASSIELKLEEARARIEDLESEKRSQRKKLEHFLRKVSEERAAWRSKEHEKVRAIIDDMKDDINREKKARQRLETVNLKLVNELADSKLAVKRHMHDYQKERKARELIEEVCDELAKEIEEDKAEIDALKSESMNLREEVDDERRMLQMAEVWREERVQMKLVDAKVALEEKYSQMNKLVGDLETFLSSRNATTSVKEVREAEVLRETVASVSNVQEVKEFTYEPAKPDDIFKLFEEMNLGEATQDGETEHSPVSHGSEAHRVSSDVNLINNGRLSDALTDQNGEFEEDDSGWETVSHQEDHRSSFSPDESVHFTSNNHQRDSNVSANGTEFQKTPLREIKEVCSVPRRQSKKVSSMAKLWSSLEGINGRVSNARKSNAGMVPPGKGGFSTLDLVGSSPDSAYANVNRGGMKGCIEWPRGTHKNNVKTKLMEAQVESQKVQLKHVLEHKI
ncbi:Actin cytoskeleton-regulatory complex pan-like protein [Hirschfeldia incana]|nr:Actin cytoskeleton-regulatory complex pan-like protein [Hirschfeldia incana]